MADLHHLRAFLAVSDELNFHRAAEKLGIVQPALSRSIRQLEAHLDVRLFERTTRHVKLTETGKAFIPEARAVLAHFLQAERTARDVEMGKAGPLTLAYMDFAVHGLLPDLVGAIRRVAPAVRINLTYLPSAQQRLELIEGRIDAGIMIGDLSAPGMLSIPLSVLPLKAVMRVGHRLAAKRALSIKDFRDEDILLGSQNEWQAFRDIVFRSFADAGIKPNVAFEASSAAALIGLASGGLGVTFYAGNPALYLNKAIAVRLIHPHVGVPIHLVLRKGPKQGLLTQSVEHTRALQGR